MNTKCFISGLAGAIVALIAADIITTLYSDYSERAISSEMIQSTIPIQKDIEMLLIENKPVNISSNNYNLGSKVNLIGISSVGVITVQAKGAGQIIILTPSKTNKSIKWQCLGGSFHAIPVTCRDS